MRIWGALAIVYVVWGSTFAAIDLAVRTIPPFIAMRARHLFAGTVLLLWGLARGPRERIGKPQLVAAAIFGAALFLGGHGSLAWAQQRIPSGVAALLIATIPLWVAIFDRLVFGKRLSTRAIVGLAVGFGGVALLVDPSAAERSTRSARSPPCSARGVVGGRLPLLPRRADAAEAARLGRSRVAGGGLMLAIVAARERRGWRASICRRCRASRSSASSTSSSWARSSG